MPRIRKRSVCTKHLHYSRSFRASGGSCLPLRSLSKLSRQWSGSNHNKVSTTRRGQSMPCKLHRKQRLENVSSGQPPQRVFSNWSRAISTAFQYDITNPYWLYCPASRASTTSVSSHSNAGSSAKSSSGVGMGRLPDCTSSSIS